MAFSLGREYPFAGLHLVRLRARPEWQARRCGLRTLGEAEHYFADKSDSCIEVQPAVSCSTYFSKRFERHGSIGLATPGRAPAPATVGTVGTVGSVEHWDGKSRGRDV
jgi:hypothetical protein